VCPCWPASTTNQRGLVTLTFDLLTLKVVSESRVTWPTSVPILVFLGLSVNNSNNSNNQISIAPYASYRGADITRSSWPHRHCSRYTQQTDRQTDRQTDVRQKHRLMPPPIRGGGIIIPRTIFIVPSSWPKGHSESSLGSFDGHRTAPSGRRPSDQATWLGLWVHL